MEGKCFFFNFYLSNSRCSILDSLGLGICNVAQFNDNIHTSLSKPNETKRRNAPELFKTATNTYDIIQKHQRHLKLVWGDLLCCCNIWTPTHLWSLTLLSCKCCFEWFWTRGTPILILASSLDMHHRPCLRAVNVSQCLFLSLRQSFILWFTYYVIIIFNIHNN